MKIQISDTNACKALFFSISFFVGLWAVRIPDIKDQIEVDYTGLGYLFVIFSIGSVLTMIVAPKITQLYSSKKISLISGILTAHKPTKKEIEKNNALHALVSEI